MCGIVGIIGGSPVNQAIYDGLTLLQHRGQDAAGIVTIDEENRFRLRKANGLVSEVSAKNICYACKVMQVSGTFATQLRAVQAFRKLSLFM